VSRIRLRHAVALAVALLALGSSVAVAAFVATISNTGNTFTAAAVFPTAIKVATGTYTGDASDNRAISVGFQPDFVIVKDTNTTDGVGRSSSMVGDLSKPLGTLTALQADNIQSFSATGFVVGLNNRVNRNNRVYHWVAIKGYSQSMKVGTYTGNGTSQAITGMGFSPENVIVLGNNAQRAVTRFYGMSRTYGFDASTGVTTGVSSLDANGFSVGNAPETNANGIAYHYIAFNDVANSVNVGSYAGSAADNRNITTVGFQPEYVLVRADDSATARAAAARPASLAGDSTLFFAGTAAGTNRIQALQSTGFQVGTGVETNVNGVTFYSLALRSSAP
jgi:uncharacterized protein with FMN-binding domain